MSFTIIKGTVLQQCLNEFLKFFGIEQPVRIHVLKKNVSGSYGNHQALAHESTTVIVIICWNLDSAICMA